MPGRPTNEPSNYLALGVQSAKDAEATNFRFFRQLDGSGFTVDPDATSEREGGDGQEVGLRYKTLVKSDGAVNANARPDAFAQLLTAVLGQDSVASIAALLHDHTITPAASLPYYTADQRWADEVERTTNVQFTGLDIEFEAGRPLKLTGQFISGGSVVQRDIASALTPVREAGEPFFYPAASVWADGAGTAKVSKGRVSIKRALDEGIQTNALSRHDVVPLNFDIDADLTLLYEDRAFYRKVRYTPAGSQVPIALATGALGIFVPLASHSARLEMPLLHWTGAAVNKLDPDGKTMWLDVAAMSVKGATHPIFGVIRTGATAPYTQA